MFMSFLCVKLLDFLGEDCSHISALLVLVDELDNVFDITPDDCLLPSADDHNYSVSLWWIAQGVIMKGAFVSPNFCKMWLVCTAVCFLVLLCTPT